MSRKIAYPVADESPATLLRGEPLAKIETLGEFQIFYDEWSDDDTLIERLVGAQAVISGWGLRNRVLAALPELEMISFAGFGQSRRPIETSN